LGTKEEKKVVPVLQFEGGGVRKDKKKGSSMWGGKTKIRIGKIKITGERAAVRNWEKHIVIKRKD